MNLSVRQYKLMWMCTFAIPRIFFSLLELMAFCAGMVRLRLLDLFPDFSNPARPPMRTLPMPSWQQMNSDLAQQPFELRYLLEGLLTHGLVTLPEIRPLMSLISRIRLNRQLEILEGLFKWTRQGSIGHDLNGESPYDNAIHLRSDLSNPTVCCYRGQTTTHTL